MMYRHSSLRFFLPSVLALVVLLQHAASATTWAFTDETTTTLHLRVEVINTFPHDQMAFTQGLLLDGGKFYESTGLSTRSSLRRVDPQTGIVEQIVNLDDALFGEGLALVGGRLIQLTWRNHVAPVYDQTTFELIDSFNYATEGWGLCYTGEYLIMSDGSSDLTFRNPQTFAELGKVSVTLDGQPLVRLNELEFVQGYVYANIWQASKIAKIDPRTGRVRALIDASGLLTAEESRAADVLNGIAWNPATKNFYLTGKLWPKLFEVRFVPVE